MYPAGKSYWCAARSVSTLNKMTEAGGLRVGLLGPVQLSKAGTPVPVPAGLGVLLAALALSANLVVSADALVAIIWAGDASRDRERNLHSRVYQVRRLLAAADPKAPRLVTQPPGYRLNLAAHELDVTVFDNLAADGRAALRAGQSAQAAGLFADALELWRGAALADVCALSARLAAAAAALEERRLTVVEDKVEAELGCGRHGELTPELVALVAEHPLRERLRGQLMLALYRSGRQADALAAYQQARRQLADQLGIDPGPQLRTLQQRILNSDPGLGQPGSQTTKPGRPAGQRARAVPRQLPASVRSFAGRQAELTALRNLIQAQQAPHGTVVISAIGGTGGVGKTALALHWAHRVADRFPDGQLFVNLRGYDPASPPVSPAQAIRGFLDALGVPGEAVPASEEARAGLYRSLVADRQLLIVLDNARDAAQIRPLLPASAGSLVLVTSRSPLHGLAATDNMTAVPLGLVSTAEAAGILAARLGRDRLAAEPLAVAELIKRCCRLPLALAIVAARAAARPEVPLAVLAEAMADSSGVLDELDTGDPSTSLRHVLSWSYAQLSAVAAEMFRLLSVHSGPDISVPAAASLAALSRPAARKALTELTDAGLLAEQTPGRYSFHDLLRAYAAEQAAAACSQQERQAALHRVLDHYLHSAVAACLRLVPVVSPIELAGQVTGAQPETAASYQAAMSWFRTEHSVLIAAVQSAAAHRMDRHAWQLAWAAGSYLRIAGHIPDWLLIARLARDAASRLGDDVALGWAYNRLGILQAIAADPEGAIRSHTEALAHFERAGQLSGLGSTRLGLAYARGMLGQPQAAYPLAMQAVEAYQAAGDLHGLAISLTEAGHTQVQLGNFERGRSLCEQALGYCNQAGHEASAAAALAGIGGAFLALGEHERAIESLTEAVAIADRLDVAYALGDNLCRLGDAYDAAGQPAAACAAWRRALAIYGDDYPSDRTKVIRARLAELDRAKSA